MDPCNSPLFFLSLLLPLRLSIYLNIPSFLTGKKKFHLTAPPVSEPHLLPNSLQYAIMAWTSVIPRLPFLSIALSLSRSLSLSLYRSLSVSIALSLSRSLSLSPFPVAWPLLQALTHCKLMTLSCRKQSAFIMSYLPQPG